VSQIDLSDLFVKPVAGRDDLVAFQYDFIPEGKALQDGNAAVVTEEENGDLIIEGYAAVFDGMDREGENFADLPQTFDAGIKAFLGQQSALCYHHKTDKCLGSVLDLERVEGKGLRMKARVDGAIRSHPELGVYYEQIKKGTLKGLSIGGFFKRAIVGGLQKITGVDFTEVSVTPVPIHPGTNFAVVAGKALSDLKVPEVPDVGEVREQDEAQIKYLLEELGHVFANLEKAVAARTTSNAAEATT
jgi:HK97 family phage prohead protease